ncbi:hypothetical protein L6R53_14275 [Myxococcota bacterium]|nr:hypothetical protein [Myxococcota bacterium]
MLPVYLGCLALGGLLILASLLMGGGDHDADTDAPGELDADAGIDAEIDAEVEAEVEVEAEAPGLDKDVSLKDAAAGGASWLPFLSLRFWTFALATFGGAGALLDLLGFSDLVAAPSALATGLGVGLAVSWAFHRLRHERVTGDVGLRQVTGREGTLLLPVAPDKTGKVRVLIDGQDVDLPARTQDGRRLELREKVLVVSVRDGVAEVTSAAPERPARGQ